MLSQIIKMYSAKFSWLLPQSPFLPSLSGKNYKKIWIIILVQDFVQTYCVSVCICKTGSSPCSRLLAWLARLNITPALAGSPSPWTWPCPSSFTIYSFLSSTSVAMQSPLLSTTTIPQMLLDPFSSVSTSVASAITDFRLVSMLLDSNILKK